MSTAESLRCVVQASIFWDIVPNFEAKNTLLLVSSISQFQHRAIVLQITLHYRITVAIVLYANGIEQQMTEYKSPVTPGFCFGKARLRAGLCSWFHLLEKGRDVRWLSSFCFGSKGSEGKLFFELLEH